MIGQIREYRNKVAFHVTKNLHEYFETRSQFKANSKDIVTAMQEFWQLAAELIRSQDTDDFRKELEPALKKAFPQADVPALDELKAYFVPR